MKSRIILMLGICYFLISMPYGLASPTGEDGAHLSSKKRKRCTFEGCEKYAQKGGLCVAHGGGTRCAFEGCEKHAKKGGLCIAHGGVTRCSFERCEKHAKKGGLCIAHGKCSCDTKKSPVQPNPFDELFSTTCSSQNHRDETQEFRVADTLKSFEGSAPFEDFLSEDFKFSEGLDDETSDKILKNLRVSSEVPFCEEFLEIALKRLVNEDENTGREPYGFFGLVDFCKPSSPSD